MSDVFEHNKRVLATLKRGDAVEFRRGLFSHWGLYIGDESDEGDRKNPQIIHLTSPRHGNASGPVNPTSGCSVCGLSIYKAIIRIDNFFDVAGNCKAYKNNSKDDTFTVRPVQDIIQIAKSMIGKTNYNLVWKNCEHFVSMCRNGVEMSDQVNRVIGTIISIIVFAVATVLALLGIDQ